MRKAVAGVVITSLVLAFTLTVSRRLSSQVIHHQSLEGTWRVVVVFDPAFDIPPFQELLSFTADGRALTTVFPLPEIPSSSRWGEWRKHGGHFDYTSYTLTSNDPESDIIRVRCRWVLQAYGNSASGVCVGEYVDTYGNAHDPVNLTVTGNRLPRLPFNGAGPQN